MTKAIVPSVRVETEVDVAKSPDEFQELLQAWLRTKRGSTLEAYRRDLEDFAQFMNVSVVAALQHLLGGTAAQAAKIVNAYKTDLRERPIWRSRKARERGDPPDRHGFAPATINRRLSAIRSILTMASAFGLVPWRLLVDWEKVKAYRDVEGCTQEDWQRMQGFLRSRVGEAECNELSERAQKIVWRDWVLWLLLTQHGLRRSEILQLRWPDDCELEGSKPSLWLVEKGDLGSRAQRTKFPLSHSARGAILRYLRVRGDHEGALILGFASTSSKTEPLSPRKVNELVASWAREAGCDRHVRPHGFRHRAITIIGEKTGGNPFEMMRFSRHKKVETLTTYVDRMLQEPREHVGLLEQMAKEYPDE